MLFGRRLSSIARQQATRMALKERLAQAELGGGADRIAAQHAKGKLTARDGLRLLFDPPPAVQSQITNYDEIGALHGTNGDGVVTAVGQIWGRPVCAFSQDFTVHGGSLGRVHAEKVVKVMEMAQRMRCPLIGLNDSGGARIQEGVDALAGYGDIFKKNVELSGLVPQLSVIMGPCAGGAVYSPALTDFIFILQSTAYMFVTGPDVVQAVTHEKMTLDELGGSAVHCRLSGVCHGSFEDEIKALTGVRELLGFLPQSCHQRAPKLETADPPDRRDPCLDGVVPWDMNKSYDVRTVITRLVDNRHFVELQSEHADNIVIGFGRLGGHTVGFVANQPAQSSGVLDIDASSKAARFVRFCDAFSIPLTTLVDVPGFLPGRQQEHHGIIRHGAKLLHAYAECTTTRLTVVLRKAFGGAYDVMSSKHLGADRVYAWPTAEIAVMGREGADRILGTRDGVDGGGVGVLVAAQKGHLDAVISPQETRSRLIRDLNHLAAPVGTPGKKHGNIPL